MKLKRDDVEQLILNTVVKQVLEDLEADEFDVKSMAERLANVDTMVKRLLEANDMADRRRGEDNGRRGVGRLGNGR